MKQLLLLVLPVLASCTINSTNYNRLTETQRAAFPDFTPAVVGNIANYKDSFKVYKIDYEDVAAISKDTRKQVWIHFFQPWCPFESPESLKGLETVYQQHADSSLLLLVSSAYDYKTLQKLLQPLSIPVYVLDDAQYGHDLTRSWKKFYQQLSGSNENAHYGDYLLRDGRLIYYRPVEVL